MLKNCTVEESLSLYHLSSDDVQTTNESVSELVQIDAIQCDRPHNSRRNAVVATQIAACVISYSLVILRVISRIWATKRLWWDDWFHIGAAVRFRPNNSDRA